MAEIIQDINKQAQHRVLIFVFIILNDYIKIMKTCTVSTEFSKFC